MIFYFFCDTITNQFKEEDILIVYVRDNNVEQAIRALKKKLQREGVFKEMKKRKHFETKGQIEARRKSEAARRYIKLSRDSFAI